MDDANEETSMDGQRSREWSLRESSVWCREEDKRIMKRSEPVRADGLTRGGFASHSSGQVLTRKRLPTKNHHES